MKELMRLLQLSIHELRVTRSEERERERRRCLSKQRKKEKKKEKEEKIIKKLLGLLWMSSND